MKPKINIIIPSIELSSELVNCLTKIKNQNYKNFFVTVVLDVKNKKKIPKLNYRLNVLVVGKKNMSYKRNLGVKKFKSNLIAFLDSDAYPPKNWLINAVRTIEGKKKLIIGGPSIPFPRQTYSEMLCHYAKRSFFVTGYLNFRKYKSPSRYCDWLESCNMIMSRNLFLKHKGMKNEVYLGEDKEFTERVKKKDSKIKVFFTPSLFIYHKERNIKKFLMQRLVFGSDLMNIIKFKDEIRSFQPILPLLVFIYFLIILFSQLSLIIKTKILLVSFFIVQVLILFNLKNYLKNFNKLFFTLILVNLANIAYAIGSVLEIFFLKKIINRKIYLRSRENK